MFWSDRCKRCFSNTPSKWMENCHQLQSWVCVGSKRLWVECWVAAVFFAGVRWTTGSRLCELPSTVVHHPAPQHGVHCGSTSLSSSSSSCMLSALLIPCSLFLFPFSPIPSSYVSACLVCTSLLVSSHHPSFSLTPLFSTALSLPPSLAPLPLLPQSPWRSTTWPSC